MSDVEKVVLSMEGNEAIPIPRWKRFAVYGKTVPPGTVGWREKPVAPFAFILGAHTPSMRDAVSHRVSQHVGLVRFDDNEQSDVNLTAGAGELSR